MRPSHQLTPSSQRVVAVTAHLLCLAAAACGRSSSSGAGTTTGAVGATSAVVTRPTVSSPRDSVEKTLSHYACYPIIRSSGPVPAGVTLKDQFNPKFLPANQIERDELCTPVSKNGSARADTVTHLLCYRIAKVTTRKDVWITNQFDSVASLRVDGSRSMCLPSNKSRNADAPPREPAAGGVDHFKCYSVLGGRDVNKTVTLVDQFGKKEKLIGKAIRLCNPTEKRVGNQPKATIAHPNAHLTCYTLSGGEADTTTVLYRNQFGRGNIFLRLDPRILCVPTIKDTLDPTTRTRRG
jgi:hypothetical protein